jgi:hypothetical protein
MKTSEINTDEDGKSKLEKMSKRRKVEHERKVSGTSFDKAEIDGDTA